MLTPFYKQRKVKFPNEFDAVDLVTDDLKVKLLPVSRKLQEFERDRAARRKVRKRTKNVVPAASSSARTTDVEMADASGGTATAADAAPSTTGTSEGEEKVKSEDSATLEDESVYREKEAKEIEALVSPELKADVGCSASGLYDLVGKLYSIASAPLSSLTRTVQPLSPTKAPLLTRGITLVS